MVNVWVNISIVDEAGLKVLAVRVQHGPELDQNLDVLQDGNICLGGKGLVIAKVVQSHSIDSLSQNIFCDRLWQGVSLEEAHSANKKPKPSSNSCNVPATFFLVIQGFFYS